MGIVLDVAAAERSIPWAREVLSVDGLGRPRETDSQRIFEAMHLVLRSRNSQAIGEIITEGFLRESTARYEEYVAPLMRLLPGGEFAMGTAREEARHFCGEVPRHLVRLSPFAIAECTVPNGLFALFDERRADVPAHERERPVVDVTWFDAAVFSAWMGCRLPSEAEWEFACAAGSIGDWCCADEGALIRYGWYSENAGGEVLAVAELEPNSFELFDLHGNVWEWCEDDYDQDYYSRSPLMDPVNRDYDAGGSREPVAHKTCRGGSIHALAEMCRSRYRFHEPADFWAGDLGFRLARSSTQMDEDA